MKIKLKQILCTAAIVSALAILTSAAGFSATKTYSEGMFADVPETQWYASSVKTAYELGFVNGTTPTTFAPDGNMTVAEALTIAARIKDVYDGKNTAFDTKKTNWYDDYVAYCIANKLIEEKEFDDYTRPIKRYEMAKVFSKTVPDDFLAAKNDIKEIADVPETNAYFDRLLLLYKAGVVMGNNEFGTFFPNNNIKRSEAAAIVNRIALPENRLVKTLTDANYGDAYYLINDGSSKFNTSDLGSSTISAWYTDNRSISAFGNGSGGLVDFNPNGPVEAWRDIDNVADGLIGWEFIANIQFGTDGTYFKITDDSKNALFSLHTKGSNFLFNDEDTGVKVEDGKLYVKIKADLDKKTAELFMNGKKIGDYKINPFVASRVYVGSDEAGIAAVSFLRCDVYKDYLVNDLFLDPDGIALPAWETTGNTIVARTGGNTYNDDNGAKLEGAATAKKTFNLASGNVIFESYLLLPEKDAAASVSLNSGDVSIASLKLSSDGIFKADGTKLRHLINNIWQCIRIEADTVTGKVEYKINGKTMGEFALDASSLSVDNIVISSTAGTVLFDDVTVSLSHEFDDYCPKPVPVTDDGYDVLLNVCSLWREGTHSGWGAESAYPDLEPALGYYDEGIVETADWEIKFMVENGIDIQHFCWYCPSGNIKEPIKRSNLNFALHDGFFNAEYSDLMKFTLMWENNGVNCTSLEQFKTYIWNYWIEYYFTDPRFYTIDNKIVMTAWNYNNFQKAFGGNYEGTKAAIAFMNEDIKQYGFDGILWFFADSHQQSAGAFEAMASIGADAAYAYHWQQDGNKYETTVNRMQRNYDFGKIHIVPTVSVGFNNVGWSGVRKPLISVSDHKKVVEYIKDTFLPKAGNDWKSKTLIVSTWNEYGEGTYVMPAPGHVGFGYLDNVRKVISGVEEQPNNIYPTEQQKARLGHLYPKSKTSLERLDIEQPTSDVPQKVVYSAKGSDMVPEMRIAEHSFDGDVIKATTTENDSAIKVGENNKMPEMPADSVKMIRIVLKSSVDSYTELFFSTKEVPALNQENCFGFKITKSDEFKEYTVYTDTKKGWTGTITGMRMDITNCPATFEVKSLELLGFSDEQLPTTIKVGTNEYTSTFNPVIKDDEMYVTAEADKGFFKCHCFYYEWSRFTGKLKIVTNKNKEIIFTVGSDIMLVDGVEQKLKEAVTLKDGLPVLPIFTLYKAAEINYEYKPEEKLLTATLFKTEYDEKLEEIIKSRIPNEFEFNYMGDSEGFGGGNTTLFVNNEGYLSGTAVKKPDGSYDPIVNRVKLSVDASKYNKVVIRMRANLPEAQQADSIELFYITADDPTWNQEKAKSLKIDNVVNKGKFVEYVFDCTQLLGWKGTVTGIRIDPIAKAGSFDIDYVRIQEDKEAAAKAAAAEAERIAKGLQIVNGDAEDTKNVAFAPHLNGAKISIVKDEEKGNVYKVEPISSYVYACQNVVFEPGCEYNVSIDVKFLANKNGKTEYKTNFHCNTMYTGADGKVDHVVFGLAISPSEGWKHVTFSFKIPEGITSLPQDRLGFYTNPVDNVGINYMFDNVKVTKVTK